MKPHSILFFLMMAFLVSCQEDIPQGNETFEHPFSVKVTTRNGELPADSTTFGFITFKSGNINPVSWGTYCFIESTEMPAKDILVLCQTDRGARPVIGKEGQLHNNWYSLMFNSTGDYLMYVLTPGMQPVNNGEGSWRIRYSRDTPLCCTMDPIEFRYDDYKVYNLPIDTITEMRSYFTFAFKKGASLLSDIIIDDVKLYNLGDTATYHPSLQIVTITDQGKEDYDGLGKNYYELELINKKSDPSTDLSYLGKDTVNVFPSNYTSEYLKNIMLEFSLTIGAAQTIITVPIGMTANPSTGYNFEIEVTSTLINITYSELRWVTKLVEGGRQITVGDTQYKRRLGSFEHLIWEPGIEDGSGTSVIK